MKNILNKLAFLILILIGLQLFTEHFVLDNKTVSIEVKMESKIEKEEKENKDECVDILQQTLTSVQHFQEYQNYFEPHYQDPTLKILTTPPEFIA